MSVSPTTDNTPLQTAVLRFVMTVLTVDHPKFCKPLRNAILILKVGWGWSCGVSVETRSWYLFFCV